MAVKHISILIEEQMLAKANYVADFEGRSLNSQILVLIRECIWAHEKENGKVTEGVLPGYNVKPSNKRKGCLD